MQRATFCKNYSEAAYEAAQRYRALICKKYELHNSIRSSRNTTLQRAAADAELVKMEEFLLRVTQMAE